MRFIDKSNPCPQFDTFLTQYGKRLHSDWEKIKKISSKPKEGERIDVGRDILIVLFSHLRTEQKGLCIYCQQSIPEKTADKDTNYFYAHIEHVQKQELHKKLVFKQSNLSVSCNGFNCKAETLEMDRHIKEFCGHYKDGNYNAVAFDDALFLNPLIERDIEQYFDYNVDMYIVPNADYSNEQQEKANFTIQLLGLQHDTLCQMRQVQYDIMLEKYQAGVDMMEELSDEYDVLPAFYSMLKNKFL